MDNDWCYIEAFASNLDTSFNPALWNSLKCPILLAEISRFRFTDLSRTSLGITLNTLRIIQVNFY